MSVPFRCNIFDCKEMDRYHLKKSKPHILTCTICKLDYLTLCRTNKDICFPCYYSMSCDENCKCKSALMVCPYYKDQIFSQDDIIEFHACKNYERHPAYRHLQKCCSCYGNVIMSANDKIIKTLRALQEKVNTVIEEIIELQDGKYKKIYLHKIIQIYPSQPPSSEL